MKLSLANDDGQTAHVVLTGRITQSEMFHDPLADLLGPAVYGRQVRLDLGQADYVDSSGIGWLLTCHKRMRQAGGSLILVNPHPLVANMLKMLKLDEVFRFETSGPGQPMTAGGSK